MHIRDVSDLTRTEVGRTADARERTLAEIELLERRLEANDIDLHDYARRKRRLLRGL
ncbi:hypothetical protein [Lysinibacter cavernae]|uniref:SHOCT domain-containing protein n=1 Tax=Lysinibacter cavernae TaxID=1640652 RepID=A0A7X5TUE2_9MICO|nr:hypothetical protein [Lysinibacter cavernae]NIH54293.1 hypothetical protein [Lysinibacter cavernae]